VQAKNGVFKREMERDKPSLVQLITRTVKWIEQNSVADCTFGWTHNKKVSNFDFYQ
jgi:hypothetical protein